MSRRVREVDSAERAHLIRAFGHASYAGLPGALIAYLLLARHIGGLLAALIGFVVAVALVGGIALLITGAGARVGSSLYMPQGRNTPGRRQYSLADALAARGQYGDAAAELERCALTYPDDVEPKLRLARLMRDELQRPQRGAEWFRRALATPGLAAASEQAVLRELIELYTHHLGEPRAALPWLARLAARHGDTTAGAWAARELSVLKQEMRDDDR